MPHTNKVVRAYSSFLTGAARTGLVGIALFFAAGLLLEERRNLG
jgi:hypothetical protein